MLPSGSPITSKGEGNLSSVIYLQLIWSVVFDCIITVLLVTTFCQWETLHLNGISIDP